MDRARDGLISEEEARTAPDSNVVTRALGVMPDVKVSIKELTYERGDRFVLCTDGVWGSMPEKKLIQLLTRTPNLSGTVEKTMISVEEIGHAQGDNHDNFTIALVETNINSQKKEPMTHSTRNLIRFLAILATASILLNVFFVLYKEKPANNEAATKEVAEEIRQLESTIAEKDKKLEEQIASADSANKEAQLLKDSIDKHFGIFGKDDIIEKLQFDFIYPPITKNEYTSL